MGITEDYNWLMEDLADPRPRGWFMMDSSLWPIGLSLLYLFFVKVAGPSYMKNRPAYDLKTFIKCYNIYQVIACCYFFWAVLTNGWTTTYSWGCQPVDYSDNPEAVRMLKVMWWLMLLKLSEFTETIVFVLRKKDRQVSGLHLYHHVSTFLLAWLGVKFVGGGMASFSIMPNSLVHIVMYTYYLLSVSKNITIQKMLRSFKPYITIMQMVQLCIIAAHAMQALLPSCHVPKFMAYIYIPNVFLVLHLFGGFYKENFTKNNKPKKVAKAQ